MVDDVDLSDVREVTPQAAPVTEPEPLTGKEKAGISLTWGIIWFLGGFLVVILGIFLWGEYRFLVALDQLENLKEASPEKLNKFVELMKELESRQANFRAFWFDTLQLILLNVLFPTLTALLGYVFGTSRNTPSNSDDV